MTGSTSPLKLAHILGKSPYQGTLTYLFEWLYAESKFRIIDTSRELAATTVGTGRVWRSTLGHWIHFASHFYSVH